MKIQQMIHRVSDHKHTSRTELLCLPPFFFIEGETGSCCMATDKLCVEGDSMTQNQVQRSMFFHSIICISIKNRAMLGRVRGRRSS